MIDTSSADYIKRMALMNSVTAKSGEAVNTANSLATASPTGAEPSTKNYTTVSNPTPMIQGREDVPPPTQPTVIQRGVDSVTGAYTPPAIATEQTVGPKADTAPFSSTSGANAKSYIDSKSANLGKDPGYTTEAGKLYADQVTKSLTAPDASSVNVQNTADTNASRRQYMANLQAGEEIGQSGFGVGTAQADRIRSNSQAGVNSANQAGQNSANDYLRNRTEQNMTRANSLENQQYGKGRDDLQDAQGQDLTEYGRSERATDRGLAAAAVTYGQGRDARGDYVNDRTFGANEDQRVIDNNRTAGRDAVADAQWDTVNGQNLAQQGVTNAQWKTLNEENKAQRAFENSQVIKNGDDMAKKSLINSLPDGPAKNTAIAELGKGTPIADVLAKVFNADGSLKIVGKTPAELALDGEKETAGQTAVLEGLTPNTDAYLKRVNEIVLAGRKATSTPIDDAAKVASTKTAKEVLVASPEKLDANAVNLLIESGDIPKLTPASTAELSQLRPGDMAKVGDTLYKVESQGKTRTWGGDYAHSPTHTPYTILTDSTGTKKVYNYDGANHDAPPKEVPLAPVGSGFTPFW